MTLYPVLTHLLLLLSAASLWATPADLPGIWSTPTNCNDFLDLKAASPTITHFFTFNNAGGSGQMLVGPTAVPFNGTDIAGGAGITRASLTTFNIVCPGHYYVHFNAMAFASTEDESAVVQLLLGGVPVGPTAELLPSLGTDEGSGGEVTLQQIINVTAPTTLQVMVTEDTLFLNEGDSAYLTIIRLSNCPTP